MIRDHVVCLLMCASDEDQVNLPEDIHDRDHGGWFRQEDGSSLRLTAYKAPRNPWVLSGSYLQLTFLPCHLGIHQIIDLSRIGVWEECLLPGHIGQ